MTPDFLTNHQIQRMRRIFRHDMKMGPVCRTVTPQQLAHAKLQLARSAAPNPHIPIGQYQVIQALSYPGTNYFITTSLYWDCDCREGYIKPSDIQMCEECGSFREDQPDSRINELRQDGIHLDWMDPQITGTLEAHGTT